MLYLTMQIDGTRYALDITQVVEVMPLVTLQPLPRAPHGVAGIIDYGGAPVPVIDLSMVLANRPAPRRFNTRIVMVRCVAGDQVQLLALIAERATETMRREPSDFLEAGMQGAASPDMWPVALDAAGPVYRVDANRILSESLTGSVFRNAVNA